MHKTEQAVLSEHYEQCLLVSWFRQTWPSVRILAIPNGGHRSKSVAARLKAEGVSRGVPDLFVPEWRLWIEVKRTRGEKISEFQESWMEYLECVNYWCIVVKGANDGKHQITNFYESKVRNAKENQETDNEG